MLESLSGYSIARLTPRELGALETVWRELQDGPDMTAFQGYEWASLTNQRAMQEHASRALVKMRYYLVSYDGEPVLIAPFRIHLVSLSPGHRRGVHLAGRNGPGDYLNFVYRNFDPAAARTAMRAATQDFGVAEFNFERLLVDTESYRWCRGVPGSKTQTHTAIQLELPESLESYTQSLSKSTRQNIRTAWNRARTDGVKIEVETLDEVSEQGARALAELKQKREEGRQSNHQTRLRRWVTSLRQAYFRFLFVDFDEPRLAMGQAEAPLILRILVDEQIAAFAFGLPDNHGGKRYLRLLQVGIDNRFARYSPGFVGLHHFITTELEGGRPNWDVIDFTRGEEKYKKQLGGMAHPYADVSLHFSRRTPKS